MATDEWPPRVWHGVVSPLDGSKLPPTRCSACGSTAHSAVTCPTNRDADKV